MTFVSTARVFCTHTHRQGQCQFLSSRSSRRWRQSRSKTRPQGVTTSLRLSGSRRLCEVVSKVFIVRLYCRSGKCRRQMRAATNTRSTSCFSPNYSVSCSWFDLHLFSYRLHSVRCISLPECVCCL